MPYPNTSPAKPGTPANSDKRNQFGSFIRSLSLRSIPAFVLLIAVLSILNLKIIFEPPYLFLVLNTHFAGIIPLVIAAIAFRSCQRNMSRGVLLIGIGMLIFGIGSIAAPLAAGLPGGRNMSITIHNTVALAGALCQLAGGAVLLSGIAPQKPKGRYGEIGLAYGIAAFVLALFIDATFSGLTPAYFLPDTGYTVIREVVVTGAIAFFGIAAGLFALTYRKRGGDFLFWYTIGLGLLATGLLSALTNVAAGDPLSWTARISQYFGCLFLFVAIVALSKEARQEKIPISDALSRFFGESLEGYRMLVENAPDAIVVINDNQFLYDNDVAHWMFGTKNLTELNKIGVLDLVDPRDRGRVRAKMEQIGDMHTFPSGEIRILRPDGTGLDISARVTPVKYEGTAAVLATLRDISERKRNEAALHTSRERLDLTLGVSLVGTFEIDFVTGTGEWNAVEFELLGLKPGDAVAGPEMFFRYVHPEDLPVLRSQWEEAARTGILDAEFRIIRADGQERWLAGKGRFLFAEQDDRVNGETPGVPLRFLGVNFDITDQKRADLGVQQSERKFRTLTENVPGVIQRFDRNRRVIYLSPQAEKTTGIAAEKFLGKTNEEMGMPEDLCARWNDLFSQVETMKEPRSLVFDFPGPAGTETYLLKIVPEFAPDGSVASFLGISTDITLQKKAEEAIRESEERFRILYATMSEGLATHEIVNEGEKAVDYVITDVNPAYETITGFARENVVGKRASELYGMGEPPYLSAYAKVAAGDIPLQFETYFPPMDKHFAISVFSQGKGKFATVFSDITKRKRAEEEMVRLQALLDHNPCLVFLKDEDGRYVYLNKTYEQLFVHSEDWQGKTDFDFWPKESATLFRENDRTVLASGTTRQFLEESTDTRDVRHVWLNYKFPFVDAQDRRYVGGIGIDVTARVQAEEALRVSEQKERERAGELDAILSTAPTPIFIAHDTAGQHITGNPAADRLLRIAHGGEMSLTAPEVQRPRNYQCVRDGYELAGDELPAQRAALGLPVEDYEFDIVFDDGVVRHVIGNGRQLLGEQGRPRGAILAVQDITERKEAEGALRQKQAEIQGLFDNTPAALVLFDAAPPYTVLVHNRSYQELFHDPFRTEGMAGLNVFDYAPTVEASGIIEIFDEVVSTQKPKQFLDFPYRSDPPNERWFNWYLAPIIIDGKTVSLVSMSLDVTEWHRAKDEVQRSRDQLEARVKERTLELKTALDTVGKERQRLFDVMESIPAMVCLLTPDYRVAWSNRSFREKFGEAGGRHCFEQCFGKTAPCEFCESFEVLKTEKPHYYEIKDPDGTVISAHDFPFTDSDGNLMILEMDIDITEQRRMEKRIREISVYNRNLIETSLDPLVTIRSDGKIGDVNEATARITGYSREELIGTNFSRYFTDPAKAQAGYQGVFQDGSVTDYALEIRHRDGRVTPVLYNATVFHDEKGAVAGVFAAARDITDQKKAQDELRKSHELLESRVRERTAELARRNEELAAAEEVLRRNNDELARNEREIREALAEKEVLLAEIHHRVKNNLSAFISLLSLEGSYDNTPAGIAMKNDLQNRARSMALIHETLYKTRKFSKVDMSVYLTTLVSQVVGSINVASPVRTSVHAEGITLDLGRATPAGLIVNELVTNSLKYAFPAGEPSPGIPCTITISMIKNNGEYFLTVKDNGIGLPPGFDIRTTKTLGLSTSLIFSRG